MRTCPHTIFRSCLLALLLMFTIVPNVALGNQSPIRIEADHMTATEKSSSVVFTGNVDAKQDDVRIRSDKMTVHYTSKNDQKNNTALTQKVEKLVCEGSVEITREKWLGTSKTMIYLANERQIILIGKAKAWQGKNMVSGEKIIYYLDEGRSEVVGRPKATVGADGTKEKKGGRVNMTILQQ